MARCWGLAAGKRLRGRGRPGRLQRACPTQPGTRGPVHGGRQARRSWAAGDREHTPVPSVLSVEAVGPRHVAARASVQGGSPTPPVQGGSPTPPRGRGPPGRAGPGDGAVCVPCQASQQRPGPLHRRHALSAELHVQLRPPGSRGSRKGPGLALSRTPGRARPRWLYQVWGVEEAARGGAAHGWGLRKPRESLPAWALHGQSQFQIPPHPLSVLPPAGRWGGDFRRPPAGRRGRAAPEIWEI